MVVTTSEALLIRSKVQTSSVDLAIVLSRSNNRHKSLLGDLTVDVLLRNMSRVQAAIVMSECASGWLIVHTHDHNNISKQRFARISVLTC